MFLAGVDNGSLLGESSVVIYIWHMHTYVYAQGI